MDKRFIESKAVLGRAQEGYLDGSYNSETTANPWKVKPSVKAIYKNIIPIIENFQKHIKLLSRPTHQDSEILALQKDLFNELFEMNLQKSKPSLKVPGVWELTNEHQRKCDVKYWDYVKERLSVKRYQKGAAALKKVYQARMLRLDQEYVKKQRDPNYKINIGWVDDIPVYRSAREERKIDVEGKQPEGKEIGVLLTKNELTQVAKLKNWGIFHLDETRRRIHWGENGREVAQLLNNEGKRKND